MKQIECVSIKEWLEQSKKHTCANKKIVPKDDSTTLTMGHACSCGTLFSLSGDNYIKTLDALKENEKNLMRKLMACESGRKKIAKSCC